MISVSDMMPTKLALFALLCIFIGDVLALET